MESERNSILEVKAQQIYTTKGKSLGIFLAILCNCMFLTSSIMVKEYKLKSSEICFIRGLVQMSLFLIVFIVPKMKFSNCFKSKRKQPKDIEELGSPSSKTSIDFGLCIIVCLCGLS